MCLRASRGIQLSNVLSRGCGRRLACTAELRSGWEPSLLHRKESPPSAIGDIVDDLRKLRDRLEPQIAICLFGAGLSHSNRETCATLSKCRERGRERGLLTTTITVVSRTDISTLASAARPLLSLIHDPPTSRRSFAYHSEPSLLSSAPWPPASPITGATTGCGDITRG